MKRKSKFDQDIQVLKDCLKALDRSTSRRLLAANLTFVVSHYTLESKVIPESDLKPEPEEK